ncbi:SEL1-like repeat protein [Xanthomonas sp. 3498]|uniref:tetratricopeptide repeat protein n=1 Tax=Xanthomonas sp. 3498 TaxID=2663863 RepID=UPI00161A0E0F|nr:SEL1-like repeat protein [Xanthomonas sp. 3498]MBB5874909.1 TPR repeat protein [Xanthomonas sp. 3498]
MDKDSQQSLLADAKLLMERGEYAGAYEKLADLVIEENPEALFLCSTFSSSVDESDKDFEIRSLKFLTRSAHLGFAPAMYALAVCYASGDLVDQSDVQAAHWYKAAAESGSDSAKLHYAMALLDGIGVPKDSAAGLRLLQELLDSGNAEIEAVLPEINERFPGGLRKSLTRLGSHRVM